MGFADLIRDWRSKESFELMRKYVKIAAHVSKDG